MNKEEMIQKAIKMKNSGYSNIAIADHLGISESAVRSYLVGKKILWRIRRSVNDPLQYKGLAAIILMADDRETAKTRAQQFLRADPDQYEVEPLTKPGEPITFLFNA